MANQTVLETPVSFIPASVAVALQEREALQAALEQVALSFSARRLTTPDGLSRAAILVQLALAAQGYALTKLGEVNE